MDTALFSTLNITNTTNFVNFAQAYAYSLPGLIQQGDIAAITIGSIILLITLLVVNKITSLLLSFIKKTIFLFITGLAVYYLATEFYMRLMTLGPTSETVVLGIAGVSVGLIGLILSINSWFTGARKSYKEMKQEPTITKEEKVEKEKTEKEDVMTELRSLKDQFSFQMIKQDKNLLSVLVYLIIGQFGVFSSPTIAPPNSQLGLVFFGLFLLGALLFVKQTYKRFRKGLFHLIMSSWVIHC